MAQRSAGQSARARADAKCCLKKGLPGDAPGSPAPCSTSGTTRKVERMPHLLSTFSERNRHQTRRTSRATTKKITTAAVATLAVRVELIGLNCAIALGVEAYGTSPVLTLCRALVAAGVDPATSLEIYRGDTLCLRVRSIADGAKLSVDDSKLGRPTFRRWRDRPGRDGAGPPIAPTAPALSAEPRQFVSTIVHARASRRARACNPSLVAIRSN
jgi:hypothetical protein